MRRVSAKISSSREARADVALTHRRIPNSLRSGDHAPPACPVWRPSESPTASSNPLPLISLTHRLPPPTKSSESSPLATRTFSAFPFRRFKSAPWRGLILCALLFLQWAGSVPAQAQWVRVDPSFPGGSGPDNAVNTMVLEPDGRLLIGGYFTNVSGRFQPARRRSNARCADQYHRGAQRFFDTWAASGNLDWPGLKPTACWTLRSRHSMAGSPTITRRK